MNDLRKIWSGQYTLLVAFWFFYELGCLATMVAGVLMLLAARALGVPTVGVVLATALTAAYFILASVGAWRSARRYGGARVWAILAKIIVCYNAARLVWRLANGGALVLLDGSTAAITLGP